MVALLGREVRFQNAELSKEEELPRKVVIQHLTLIKRRFTTLGR